MKKIIIWGLLSLLLNAYYIPVTLVGQGNGETEKAKKEALSDLSNQVSVNVKSEFKEFQKAIENEYKNYKQNLIKTSSNLPLKSVRFKYENGDTLAILNSTLALNVYKNELNRLKKEIKEIQKEIQSTKSNTQKYRLYKELLKDVEEFNKNKIVAIVLRGENLPTINISEVKIKNELEKLSQKVASISLAVEILSKGINEKDIYIYPIKTNGSNEVTQFARVLKDEISKHFQIVDKPINAKYFIRGSYEILKGKIFVTIKLMNLNNEVLKTNSVTIDKKAYKYVNYKPKTISFDKAINSNFIKNKFRVKLGIKGYYSSNGIDLTKGDTINLVLKANKPMCYYIVGHTLETTGKKYSYLVQLKDDEGKEAFIDRITGEDVNKNIALADMEITKPFGRESLQLFGQTLVHGKCNISIPKCEWRGDLCIIDGKPSKVIEKTRALMLKKHKKAKTVETIIDFTSFSKK
jgi:archaellum component FlaC